jgi:class 3 adenylate cyclase/DNA-binding SARP family transcriptional activator
MDFRILGPLEVLDGDRALAVRGGKQRALLALLLVHANRTLSIERIVDELWGEAAPETAAKMVQIYVSQLRKLLPDACLHTRPPGYALELPQEQLDLIRFERLVAAGRDALAEGETDSAAARLAEALALWRGPALAEFASEPFARLEGARLEELQLGALEERIEADLACGRHAELVGELESLVLRHPLREGLRRQQMLALYRSGRQAEALASYRAARRLLTEELGLEPSPALRELQRRILDQDPQLEPTVEPPAETPAAAPSRSAPAGEQARGIDAPSLMTSCPSCGDDVHAGSRFCPSCGAALAERDGAEAMLKLVTVLFADVVGSTSRAESRHPEDVRALMADYFAAMSQEIRAEGGTIEKFVGDAIMAVFGVPTAHEDDAVRAVRAARRMLGRLRTWNATQDPANTLEIRIGISTGEVLASGVVGGDLLVTGDAVNVAARLEQTADPGTIAIGERTARAVRRRFELRTPEQPRLLKGKSEAVEIWLVGSERAEGGARSGVGSLEAPLVGRDHELAFLRATFERVRRERRPELVTLVGDAGIGKSRLVREFLASLDVEAQVLTGRCLAYGQGVTLRPLAEMLKTRAGVLDSDPAATAAARIAELVETVVDPELSGERARIAAALASTLGLRAPDDPLASLHPRELYRELVGAWRMLLASMGRQTPVVAVVEDLHWADPTMLDVLDELAERLEGPILVLCTARPDLLRLRPDWGGGRRGFASLPLDPLSGDESEQLVSHLLELDAFSEVARRRILERSAGNPFFLEEIVRHLIDDGSLVRHDGRGRARDRVVEDVEIPDSVQAVILARLDLLSPEERRLAQRAAVVGRVFWDGAAAALARVDDLDAALTTLRRREFVVERLASSIAGQREFVFKHVLTRDVAYETLPRKERGRAHAQTAAWIEQTSGERTEEVAELLAHHYDAAYAYLGTDELRRKAREQLLSAATNAHRRFVIERGESFARRAADLSEGPAERVEALETLGDLHYHAGDAAWRAYTDALAEIPESDPAFPRLAGKAAVFGARWVGTMQDLPGIDAVRRVIEAGLRAAPTPSSERTLLLVTRGFLLVQREGLNDDATHAAVEEAVAAAEELGDADLLSAALDLVQAELMRHGRYGEEYRSAKRRSELVPRMRDPREASDSHAMVAWSAQQIGRYGEAEAHATACIENARGFDAGTYLHGLAWRVGARFMLGDWDGALADQTEIERVAALDARELPAPFTMRAYTQTAVCHVIRGDYELADRYIELSLRYFRRRSHPHHPGTIHAPPLALALARRARIDEALDLVPLVPRGPNTGLTLEILCEIAALRGAWNETAELAAAAADETENGELLALPLFVDRLEGRTAAALGDPERARLLLRRSAEGFAALAARWEEAWSRLLLAEAIAAVDGREAERELASALPVFERLGSVREAERARTLLAAVAA